MVMDEIEKKKELEEKSVQIQNEIDALLNRVNLLKEDKRKHDNQIKELETIMEEKLKPLTNKKIDHEQELEMIKQRQKETEEKSVSTSYVENNMFTSNRINWMKRT